MTAALDGHVSAARGAEVDALRQIARGVRELARRWTEDRLRVIRWLPHQDRLLRDRARYRLLRTGNQVGKTEVGLAEVLYAALGEHPYDQPTLRAGVYWVVCAGWSQSRKIQLKSWDLVPRARVAAGTTCTPEVGYGGRHPTLRIMHASGEWSYVEFHTTSQESLDVAGATIDGALFDEPPRDEQLYDEVVQRVRALNGWILLTLTPLGAPVYWLRELVRSGAITEHHQRLEPEALVPVGHDRPLRQRDASGRVHEWSAAWVEHTIRSTGGADAAVRLHGEWETRQHGAYFAHVYRSRAVVEEIRQVPVQVRIGIDHGHRPGKQYACLVYTELSGDPPRVIVADEYSPAGDGSDIREDAQGILDMLERNGWEWTDLHAVYGDRVHMPGAKQQKSNIDLSYRIAGLIGVDVAALHPRIQTVKRGEGRGAGSVLLGLRWWHRALSLERVEIMSDCARAIESLPRYRIRSDDEHKDVVDALRYAVDDLIFGGQAYDAPSIRIG